MNECHTLVPNCRDFRIVNADVAGAGVDDNRGGGDSSSDSNISSPVCLGMADVFVALFLVVLVVLAIVGNALVILSVALYRRMRTFTNVLLVSLSSADLFVGILIMPIAVVSQLQRHRWTFGPLICKLWASADVLLCTASILNLCVISLDRYFAITSPLRYTRTRSHKLAAGLVMSVWVLATIVCSPPLLVPEWQFKLEPYTCGYVKAIPYRIYSALGSFYIPLFVMLFVYYKIFRVANNREQMLNIDRRGSRSMQMWHKRKMTVTGPAVRSGPLRSLQLSSMAIAQYHIMQPIAEGQNRLQPGGGGIEMTTTTASNLHTNNCTSSTLPSDVGRAGVLVKTKGQNSFDSDLAYPSKSKPKDGKKRVTIVDEGDNLVPLLTETAKEYFEKSAVPWTLVGTANEYYDNSKPNRNSREKMIYLKERKALKTIGIVVCGFIICWLPFFVLYVVEVVCDSHVSVIGAAVTGADVLVNSSSSSSTIYTTSTNLTLASESLELLSTASTSSKLSTIGQQMCFIPPLLADIFLWLGYSNSVANPIVYTFYNRDFRRCFKDLLSAGCLRRSVNRRMSVRRLHQTRL